VLLLVYKDIMDEYSRISISGIGVPIPNVYESKRTRSRHSGFFCYSAKLTIHPPGHPLQSIINIKRLKL